MGERRDVAEVCVVGQGCIATRGVAAIARDAGYRVTEQTVPDSPSATPSVLVISPRLAVAAGTVARLVGHGMVLGRVLMMVPPQSCAGLRAVASGVAGCIGPATPNRVVVDRIRCVAGGRPVGARAAGAVGSEAGMRAARLTGRQSEVLALAAQGRSNAEAASDLCVSERTVRNTLSALYGVLGVRERSEAVAWAWATGWVDLAAMPPVVHALDIRGRP